MRSTPHEANWPLSALPAMMSFAEEEGLRARGLKSLLLQARQAVQRSALGAPPVRRRGPARGPCSKKLRSFPCRGDPVTQLGVALSRPCVEQTTEAYLEACLSNILTNESDG